MNFNINELYNFSLREFINFIEYYYDIENEIYDKATNAKTQKSNNNDNKFIGSQGLIEF